MDENYLKDRLEMYSRRRSSRENSFNRDIAPNRRDSGNRRISHANSNASDQQQSSFSYDDNNAPISTISGSTQPSLAIVTRTPSNISKSSKTKDRRKKSATGSDVTDRSDSSKKTNRRRLSNVLTSSFLRKKRIEYAGIIND